MESIFSLNVERVISKFINSRLQGGILNLSLTAMRDCKLSFSKKITQTSKQVQSRIFIYTAIVILIRG